MRDVQLISFNICRASFGDTLQKLEWEGIVASEVRKGYNLAQFSEDDILEIYQKCLRMPFVRIIIIYGKRTDTHS